MTRPGHVRSPDEGWLAHGQVGRSSTRFPSVARAPRMLVAAGMLIQTPAHPLSCDQAIRLLDGLVHEQVRSRIGWSALARLEERIAIEPGRIPGTTDDQMLELARTMIARALHEIADAYCCIDRRDDSTLRHRYLNAVCRAVDPGRAEPE